MSHVEVTHSDFLERMREADDWQLVSHSDDRRFLLAAKKDGEMTVYITKDPLYLTTLEYSNFLDGLHEIAGAPDDQADQLLKDLEEQAQAHRRANQ